MVCGSLISDSAFSLNQFVFVSSRNHLGTDVTGFCEIRRRRTLGAYVLFRPMCMWTVSSKHQLQCVHH